MKCRLLKLWITIGSNDTKKKEGLSRKYHNRLVSTKNRLNRKICKCKVSEFSQHK